MDYIGVHTYTCSPNKNTCKYHSTPDTYDYSTDYFSDPYNSRDLNPTEPMNHGGAEWLHGHLRRYGDVYVNQW